MSVTRVRFANNFEWVTTGASDELIITQLPQNRSGVQLSIGGENIEDLIVTVTLNNGVEHSPQAETGTGSVGLIGRGFLMKEIKVSGASAGSHAVRFE